MAGGLAGNRIDLYKQTSNRFQLVRLPTVKRVRILWYVLVKNKRMEYADT